MATQQYSHTRVRSPYFLQKASTDTGVTLELYIWVGDGLSDTPASPQYTLTKEVYDGAATFEIAELLRDFLNQTSTLSSGSAWWKADLNDGTGTTSTYKQLALEGYHTYESGLQHPGTHSPVDAEEVCLPADVDGTYRVTVAQNANGVIPVSFNNTASGTPTNGARYSIYDSEGGLITSVGVALTEQSNGQIQYIPVNTTYSYVRVFYNTAPTFDQIWIDDLRCSKYDPIRLLYVNKKGAKNYFHFGLKSVENIDASSDTFKRSLVNYSALTNGNNLHAVRKRITGTKQSFLLNTDWISEYYVAQLEELMLSEYVWLVKTSGNPIPVNIKTSQMQKKTHLNDKLINYSIEVETASEYINTVR